MLIAHVNHSRILGEPLPSLQTSTNSFTNLFDVPEKRNTKNRGAMTAGIGPSFAPSSPPHFAEFDAPIRGASTTLSVRNQSLSAESWKDRRGDGAIGLRR
jgi:hypothetical protein